MPPRKYSEGYCERSDCKDRTLSNTAYLAKWIAALDPELAHNWALRDVHGQDYGMSQAQVDSVVRPTCLSTTPAVVC